MLEIRRGIAARSYENVFFRQFAKNLSNMFEKYKIEGLLLANSECSHKPTLQIDALLLTQNKVLIIDFKNFGGDIVLPDDDDGFYEKAWHNENDIQIKGGSFINPFKQLEWQRKTFGWVCKDSTINNNPNDEFKTGRVKRIVCFQRPISLKGDIPGKVQRTFFITDSDGYQELIKDILDVESDTVQQDKLSFTAFKREFIADQFDVSEKYGEIVESVAESDNEDEPGLIELDIDGLYRDQVKALNGISEFLDSKSDNILILQGTCLSGKSHLIPFIQKLAFEQNIPQVELLVPSSRVAENLLSDKENIYQSMYSYIYGGGVQKEPNDDTDNEIEVDLLIQDLDVIPIKKCDQEERTLFIIDESQMISDSYHEFNNLRFGSGKLLEDFMTYVDLSNSKRKLIFIGDSYQITFGKQDENCLNPSYMKERYLSEIRTQQLIDKPDKSEIVNQALQLVDGIRSHKFNKLKFNFSNHFCEVNKSDTTVFIKDKLKINPDLHILCYTNEKSKAVNDWIKEKIIKNGREIAQKDLILFNNTFEIPSVDDPFARAIKIFNGQFARVINVNQHLISENVTPKGKGNITLNFRELGIQLQTPNQNVVTVLSLENYRLSSKGELSEEDMLALKILLNRELSIEKGKHPYEGGHDESELLESDEYRKLLNKQQLLEEKLGQGERVKTKLEEIERQLRKLNRASKRKHYSKLERVLARDTSSKYFQYKNSAHLRYGWALTVHKAKSYIWNEVVFDVDRGETVGKTNPDYFRWVYTGLTRASTKVSLINYEPINPLSKISIKDMAPGASNEKKFYYLADMEKTMSDDDSSLIEKYNFNDKEHVEKLIQLYQFVAVNLSGSGIDIESINHKRHQEFYNLTGQSDEKVTISIYYNNKGQFKIPNITKSEPQLFGTKVITQLNSNSNLTDFSFIKDRWRAEIYKNIADELKQCNYYIKFIIQSEFGDTLKIGNDESYLVVDMSYGNNGFYSSIIAKQYNDQDIWNHFTNVLGKFRS